MFANSRRRPRLEHFEAGASCVVFEAESAVLKCSVTLLQSIDARVAAAWIRRALAGEASRPLPVANQIARCLDGAGCAQDMNQAGRLWPLKPGAWQLAICGAALIRLENHGGE